MFIFAVIVTIILMILKKKEIINISWPYVFCLMYIYAVILILVLIFIGFFVTIDGISKVGIIAFLP